MPNLRFIDQYGASIPSSLAPVVVQGNSHSYVQNTLDRAYSSDDTNYRELSADPISLSSSFESISV